MTKTIFTPFQQELFNQISQNSFIGNNFYFSGGTALAEFYLHHRYSEDFDFFTDKDISFDLIRINLEKEIKKDKINLIDYQFEKEAKIFFVKRGSKERIKLQFCYWPFKSIGKPIKKGLLRIDSLIDITIGKLNAILTRDQTRDFIDFYFIQKEKNYPFNYLTQLLEKKFYFKVDPIFLGSRLIKIKGLYDYPKMIKSLEKKELISYFFDLAKDQKTNIFSVKKK